MKKSFVLILCLVFTLVSLGCLPFLQPEPTPTPTATATIIPSATPTATLTLTPTTIPSPTPTLTPIPSLMLENHSGVELCHVFIAPNDGDSWGDDVLYEDESIPVGGMRGFDMPVGIYNAWGADCDWNDIGIWWEIDIGDELTTLTVGPKPGLVGDATVTLVNDSETPICYVHIDLSSDEYWGVNWLNADEIIRTGASRTFRLPPDTYDLLAEDCDFEEIDVIGQVAITDEYTWNVGGTSDSGAAPSSGAPATTGSGNGFIYVENQLPGAGTCRISAWGNGQELLLDGGLGEAAIYEVPPGSYGWQGFIGNLQTGASAMTVAPGGYCSFTCLPEYLSWNCVP